MAGILDIVAKFEEAVAAVEGADYMGAYEDVVQIQQLAIDMLKGTTCCAGPDDQAKVKAAFQKLENACSAAIVGVEHKQLAVGAFPGIGSGFWLKLITQLLPLILPFLGGGSTPAPATPTPAPVATAPAPTV